MRTALVYILALPATLLAEDKAKDLLKRIEQPILKAKSLQTSVEIVQTAGKDALVSLNGRLVIAPGNKVRLEFKIRSGGPRDQVLVVSDGTKQRMIVSDSTGEERDFRKDGEVRKRLSERVLAMMSRCGVWLSVSQILIEERARGPKPEDFDLEKDLVVSNVKIGKKEVVAGKETQALEYDLMPSGEEELKIPVVVWIDTKTNRPVKRVVTIKEEKETTTITETYEAIVLDETIDDKEFKVPK